MNIIHNGVGVALTKCFFCHSNDKIVINKTLTKSSAKKVESMHSKVIDMEPCGKCFKAMDLGIIIITIDNSKSEPDWNKPPSEYTNMSEYEKQKRGPFIPNPWRAGGWFVVRDEFVTRAFGEEYAKWAIDNRWMFMEHQAAIDLGLIGAKATMDAKELGYEEN